MVCACHNWVSIPRPPDKPWDVGFSIRNMKKLHLCIFSSLLFFSFFSFDCFTTTERKKFDRIFDHHALYQTDDVALVLVVLVGDDDE